MEGIDGSGKGTQSRLLCDRFPRRDPLTLRFPDLERWLVDELFVITQPAHLQKRYSEKLSAEERDLLRADMLRERLRSVSRPKPKPSGPAPLPEKS